MNACRRHASDGRFRLIQAPIAGIKCGELVMTEIAFDLLDSSKLHNVKAYPSFHDYARGVLCEHDNFPESALPFTPEQLAEMRRRFPPRKRGRSESP
jgi:hypothetical protein